MNARPLRAGSLIPLLTLIACATAQPVGSKPAPVSAAVEQPFRDLSMIRDQMAPAIAAAAAAPYARPSSLDCVALAADIGALNTELGPDADDPKIDQTKGAQELFGDALSGALHLPFRGVVRRLSGAEARDRLLRRAVNAAIARRGFLRALADQQGCQAASLKDLL